MQVFDVKEYKIKFRYSEKATKFEKIFHLKFDATKGQLISECLFDVLNFLKQQQKICQISALESKKWLNHKIKAYYDQICYLMY